jgi:hypothetical protein
LGLTINRDILLVADDLIEADRHGKHLNATIQLSKRGRDSSDLMPF